ncbi:uncharacterized protein MONOS_8861 [Monocercomonoides exilis]|uniref:uncharacterized protein n=1 Tax=Monocercomonoides exilis TaxID=2049356 RepID=UPI0035593A31|nr:hypothetical protein MONOS_8861 [Monocercomonoides exilis]|eukprot:MONOS_8861.1-p1 / transcript=MONOS_8861.1 / gene=MONOS_8861 / organism=Monocercomonoides_exilis_PA203 / gene_product=unspecified product / transcript_product=unspecified product / location=Mono_scaffold00347:2259-3125(-) / protein_length=260 / sequence_SO=supercontig / SO=protein_coding / is_pseudo=false
MRGMVKKQTEESIVSRKEREESKRRLLQRLNLHHFSSTRAIFPSFGSPVFFEVPIANTTEETMFVGITATRIRKTCSSQKRQEMGMRNETGMSIQLNETNDISDECEELFEDPMGMAAEYEVEDEIIPLTDEYHKYFKSLFFPQTASVSSSSSSSANRKQNSFVFPEITSTPILSSSPLQEYQLKHHTISSLSSSSSTTTTTTTSSSSSSSHSHSHSSPFPLLSFFKQFLSEKCDALRSIRIFFHFSKLLFYSPLRLCM